jgi:hypothetical protein
MPKGQFLAYFQRHGVGHHDCVSCTLAFDATLITSSGILPKEAKGQSGFVFLVLPLDGGKGGSDEAIRK